MPMRPGGWAGIECQGRAAVLIEPVSADSLSTMGIFAVTAGDFRRFRPPPPQKGVFRDESGCAKRPDFSPILASLGKPGRMQEWVAGAEVIEPPNGQLIYNH